MLREEVEQVRTMIEQAYIPLQQQVNNTFADMKKADNSKEIEALKKRIEALEKKCVDCEKKEVKTVKKEK